MRFMLESNGKLKLRRQFPLDRDYELIGWQLSTSPQLPLGLTAIGLQRRKDGSNISVRNSTA
jgi:hypothetical protein